MDYLIRLRMRVMLSGKDSKWLSYTSEMRLVDSNFNTVTWMRSCFRGLKWFLLNLLLKLSGFKLFGFGNSSF